MERRKFIVVEPDGSFAVVGEAEFTTIEIVGANTEKVPVDEETARSALQEKREVYNLTEDVHFSKGEVKRVKEEPNKKSRGRS